MSEASRGSARDRYMQMGSWKSSRKSCRSFIIMLKFSWSDKMCCILNSVFYFINLHFSFLYGVIGSLKKSGMLITQAHKGCLETETAGKKGSIKTRYSVGYWGILRPSFSLTVVMGFLSLGCPSTVCVSLYVLLCPTQTADLLTLVDTLINMHCMNIWSLSVHKLNPFNHVR